MHLLSWDCKQQETCKFKVNSIDAGVFINLHEHWYVSCCKELLARNLARNPFSAKGIPSSREVVDSTLQMIATVFCNTRKIAK